MSSSKSSKWGLFFKLAVSGTVIAYLMSNLDLKAVLQQLQNLQAVWVFAAAALFLVLQLLTLWRWTVLLNVQNMALPFQRALKYHCIGQFFNTFMIGTTGGDLVKMYYVAQHSQHKRTCHVASASTIVVDRLLGLAGLVFLVALALFVNQSQTQLKAFRWPVGLAALAVFIAGLLVLNAQLWSAVHSWIEKRSTQYAMLQWFYTFSKRVVKAFEAYSDCPQILVACTALAMMIHSILCLFGWCIAQALGVQGVPMQSFFVLIPLVAFVSALPISVSGWGVGEAASVSLMALYGVGAEQALAMSLMNKMLYLSWGLCCAVPYIFSRKPESELTSEAHSDTKSSMLQSETFPLDQASFRSPTEPGRS